MKHDVRVTRATANLGILVQCVNCPEFYVEAEYEYHDIDGTVYFASDQYADLIRFLLVHPTQVTKAAKLA